MLNSTQMTIPCHWDKDTIRQVVSLPQDLGISIGEVYGSMANGGPVGHGRPAEAVINTTSNNALNYRIYLKSVGLKFTYLLNAPFRIKTDVESGQQLHAYLDWVLNVLKPDAVTIASPDLMEEVRKLDKDIGIHISTIASVKSATDLKKYLRFNPNRVVAHHDVGKDWRALSELVAEGEKHGIDVEMLATEGCIFHCPDRETHYEYLAAQRTGDCPFHTKCNTKVLVRPREILLAGGIIRPEDTRFYEEMGVKYIKITGRSKPAEWLPEVVEAYVKRGYDGNLIRLLGIDSAMSEDNWIFLNNKSLDGFIAGFPQGADYKSQCGYCDSWIIRLYNEGSFALNDGTSYRAEANRLILENRGENVRRIISREREG